MHYDALFVINQNVNLISLAAFCQTNSLKTVFILSTHFLFPEEKESFKHVFKGKFYFSTMVFFLDEATMDTCDNEASLQISSGAASPSQHSLLSLKNKNFAVTQKVIQTHKFDKIFAMPGLGIDFLIWQYYVGAIELACSMPHHFIQQKENEKMQVHIIETDMERYIFIAPLKRLTFKDITEIKTYTLNIFKSDINQIGTIEILDILYSSIGKSAKKDIIATTVHEYSGVEHKFELPVYVFIDGYHPPNYNRTYIDIYSNSATFLSPDPISRKWFFQNGYRVLPAPQFIRPAVMAPCSGKEGPILLALNHAGNWSALIDRSDTDILVMGFAEAAEKLPSLDFIVRLHPTMDHPEHEGINSQSRLMRFIEWKNLRNLQCSNNSLEEDIERAALVCSEYSQVLISSWLRGIPGFSINLTRRRSYMSAYHALGFPEATSVQTIIAIIDEWQTNRKNFIFRHNAAVENYNNELQKFYDDNQCYNVLKS